MAVRVAAVAARVVRAVMAMSCFLFISCDLYRTIQSKCQNLSYPVIDGCRHPFGQLGYQPPAAGNVSPPFFSIQGEDDLACGLFGRSHPELRSLGHFRVDKAGLDIRYKQRISHFTNLYMKTFEIGALKGLAGAIRRRMS